MSFKSLLVHRCDLYELTSVDSDGSPVVKFQKINPRPIHCRLDVTFIRQGKDAMWLPSAGRTADRTGTMFFLPNAPLKSGMRALITRGPKGVFELAGAIDEVWGAADSHHYETGVTEVASLNWRPEIVQGQN